MGNGRKIDVRFIFEEMVNRRRNWTSAKIIYEEDWLICGRGEIRRTYVHMHECVGDLLRSHMWHLFLVASTRNSRKITHIVSLSSLIIFLHGEACLAVLIINFFGNARAQITHIHLNSLKHRIPSTGTEQYIIQTERIHVHLCGIERDRAGTVHQMYAFSLVLAKWYRQRLSYVNASEQIELEHGWTSTKKNVSNCQKSWSISFCPGEMTANSTEEIQHKNINESQLTNSNWIGQKAISLAIKLIIKVPNVLRFDNDFDELGIRKPHLRLKSAFELFRQMFENAKYVSFGVAVVAQKK